VPFGGVVLVQEDVQRGVRVLGEKAQQRIAQRTPDLHHQARLCLHHQSDERLEQSLGRSMRGFNQVAQVSKVRVLVWGGEGKEKMQQHWLAVRKASKVRGCT